MRYSQPDSEQTRSQAHRAAIFVDYENLYRVLTERLPQRANPDEYISEMLDELRRYLLEQNQTQTAHITAYADFGALGSDGQYVQRGLYLQGAEPRFVPASLQDNASEIQLCVDSIDVLHNRPDIHTFVLLTGSRPYLPLVQQFKRYGRETIVASLNPPPATENVQYVEDDIFFDAANLLDQEEREQLRASSGASGSSGRPKRSEPVTYVEVTSPGAYRALEIIEEHFGQYDEVYLTPLLRKMSELLDESRFDPKSIISTLEDSGAVWLEKRRGFPYDYTVLIVDEEHPDVQNIQESFYSHGGTSDGASYQDDEYEEDGYEEDGYDEYDYYDEDDYLGDDDEEFSEDYADGPLDDEANFHVDGEDTDEVHREGEPT